MSDRIVRRTDETSSPIKVHPMDDDEAYVALQNDWRYADLGEIDDPQSLALRVTLDELIDTLRWIEGFIRSVLSRQGPIFVFDEKQQRFQVKDRSLAGWLHRVFAWFEVLSPECGYSPEVELFRGACLQMREKTQGEWFCGISADPTKVMSNPYEHLNEFVELIRANALQSEYLIAKKRGREKMDRRMRTSSRFVRSIFAQHSKVLVMRVDFSYRKEHVGRLTVEDVKRDLGRFLNNRRGNHTLFREMLGYCWKLEDGFEKGLHFHVVFFYDGHDVKSDSFWADKLGEYWRDRITKGRGLFHNCNRSKSSYKRLGIGMIESRDQEKIDTLIHRVLGYMAKTGQHFRRKGLLDNVRCFDTGGERVRRSNAGRPRKVPAERRTWDARSTERKSL